MPYNLNIEKEVTKNVLEEDLDVTEGCRGTGS